MRLKIILGTFLLALSTNLWAVNSWHWGNIDSIITVGSDGSFQVKLDNPTIKSTCLYDIVYFMASDMGEARTKLAFSMALSAFAADKQWGVVIQLPTTADTGCFAAANSSQGAGIQ